MEVYTLVNVETGVYKSHPLDAEGEPQFYREKEWALYFQELAKKEGISLRLDTFNLVLIKSEEA